MQPTPPQPDNSATPSEPAKAANASWRSTAKNALSALIGWQTVPALIIAVYLFVGVFGPVLAPFDPSRGTVATRLCPPLAIEELITSSDAPHRAAECSSRHILGTDQNGKDIFSRLLHGARTSLSVVGPSVAIGTVLGVVIGVLINGLRSKRRLIGYLIVCATLVPFGIFLVDQPEALAILNVISMPHDLDVRIRLSSVTSFSCVSALVAFALIAVAYRFDDRAQPHWTEILTTEREPSDFNLRFLEQVVGVGPWIILAAFASVALILPPSFMPSFQTSSVWWTIEPGYLLEHIGMLGPIVPMVLFPLAFATFGAWWVYRHILGRFNIDPKSAHEISRDRDHGTVAAASDVPSPSINEPAQPQPAPRQVSLFRHVARDVTTLKLRRWLPVIVAVAAVLIIIRFGVYEAWPHGRYLFQGSSVSSESPSVRSFIERNGALECANVVGSKLMTLRSLTPDESVVDPGQRCLDLYHKQRNAPFHSKSLDFALRALSQTITLSLIGAVTATALAVAISSTPKPVRRIVYFIAVLIALTGLSIAFARIPWLIVIESWTETSVLLTTDKGAAIQAALGILRDFSTGFGIAVLIAALTLSSSRDTQAPPKPSYRYLWMGFIVPCVLFTSALIITFYYPFPSFLLLLDDQLAVIADPSEFQYFRSGVPPFRNWLWTYWFALIAYAAMVFALFYAAISGFLRFAANRPNRDDVDTDINPDNSSQDADPT